MQRTELAFSRALPKAGSRMAMSRAMMATTTSSSMRVKAKRFAANRTSGGPVQTFATNASHR